MEVGASGDPAELSERSGALAASVAALQSDAAALAREAAGLTAELRRVLAESAAATREHARCYADAAAAAEVGARAAVKAANVLVAESTKLADSVDEGLPPLQARVAEAKAALDALESAARSLL